MAFEWLRDATRIGIGVATFGQSELAIQGYKALTAGPDTVNARGDVLSDAEKDMLSGMPPEVRARIFSNWLTAGGAPKPVDPGVTLARSAALSGAYQKAGAGRGIGGFFGLGKISPMMSGVPYSMPPVPNLVFKNSTGG
jgi:hypothetical protein